MNHSLLIAKLIKQKEELVSLKTGYLKYTHSEETKEKRIKKNEACPQDLQNSLKRVNPRVIGLKEEVDREIRVESLFKKVITQNFPSLKKDISIQVRECCGTPSIFNSNKTTSRYLTIKFPKVKDKERILKGAREKEQITYKGAPICLEADFSVET
jgi:hypothetical protein